MVEIDLLSAGLLERITTDSSHTVVRLTDAGINHLASATQGNRQARLSHESLVDEVVESLLREGRIAWMGLCLRAKVQGVGADGTQGKMCQPDVFSLRNSSRQDYLEPVVHEIKVNRSDLLGDLERPEKCGANLDVGGQCWDVPGCDRTGHPIAKLNEIPMECGVVVFQNNPIEVTRMAPKRTVSELPFYVWMELAKATPRRVSDWDNPQVTLTCG